MTNTTGGSTPAGWYPVAPGSSQLRWWDGSAWTEQVHDQAAAQQYGGAAKATAGTNPNTVWIWILAVLPPFAMIPLFFLDFRSYFAALASSTGDSASILQAEQALFLSPGYLLTIAFGFVSWVVVIVLALLDHRRLKALGVPKPFHWAFTFIPSTYGYVVYMIGRFVVVKRRTGTGLVPLWVWIAAVVVYFIVSIVWVVNLFATIASTIPFSS